MSFVAKLSFFPEMKAKWMVESRRSVLAVVRGRWWLPKTANYKLIVTLTVINKEVCSNGQINQECTQNRDRGAVAQLTLESHTPSLPTTAVAETSRYSRAANRVSTGPPRPL